MDLWPIDPMDAMDSMDLWPIDPMDAMDPMDHFLEDQGSNFQQVQSLTVL